MRLENLSPANHALRQFLFDEDMSGWYLNKILKNIPIEWSKSLNYNRLKKFMPSSEIFLDTKELANLINRPIPFVVKFNTSRVGIQTVIVKSCEDIKQVYFVAKTTNCYQGIVQNYIQGKEYTVTVLVGKHNWVTLGTACDYKKQFENDFGLNTFGLGSISPCPNTHASSFEIIDNVVNKLQKEFDYQGPLSCQFIIDSKNNIWLLEYNARVCDPEFQSTAELVDPSRALVQCKNGLFIEQPTIENKRAVTISLIHNQWPTPQSTFAELHLEHDSFKIRKNQGLWANNLYWGSITNSGAQSYRDLANSIYSWLNKQNIEPYRYRTDIGQ